MIFMELLITKTLHTRLGRFIWWSLSFITVAAIIILADRAI